MGEVVNVLVAFAVIVFVVRWATSSKESPAERSAASVLGFKPKNVTNEMVEAIHNMFPDIPSDNIRYDLLRTGSVEVTTNKLIERGFLPAPPEAYYTLYPRQSAPTNSHTAAARPAAPAAVAGPSKPKSQPSLIDRYNLQGRVQSDSAISSALTPEEIAGKSVWEDSADKREAMLRERKAQMILAARQRLLAQQKNGQPATGASS